MLRCSFQRAALAIILIGLMVAPLGVCLPPPHQDPHRCCAEQSQQPPSLQTNCCIVRDQLPADLVAPKLSCASHPTAARVSISSSTITVSLVRQAIVVDPPFSPPPGSFSLRI